MLRHPSSRAGLAIVATCCLAGLACRGASTSATPPRHGPYLGQVLPGTEPQLFAPGIVSTGMADRDLAITPDGDEMFFCVQGASFSYGRILEVQQLASGDWSTPRIASFSGPFQAWDLEPFVAPDGGRLLFASNRPRAQGQETAEDSDIFFVQRGEDGWGPAVNLGAPVCSEANEFFPALTREGTIYFTRAERGTPINRIYRSRLEDGHYLEPELLPEQVNTGRNRFNATVAPDESFVILSAVGREDSIGRTDYYVVFRNPDDTWSEPVNLGEKINVKDGFGYSASLSPDGSILFFMSARTTAFDGLRGLPGDYAHLLRFHHEPANGNPDIYWVSASFINSLRPPLGGGGRGSEP